MKKFFAISAMLALVASACTKETGTSDVTTSAPCKGPEMISASFDVESVKVAMSDDGAKVSYTWKAGDRILFVNPSDASDSVRYVLASGEGTAKAEFEKEAGDFSSGATYVCCHPGNGVRVNADGEFTDKKGNPILKGQNPTYVWNYMVFAGYGGSPKAYSFKGSEIPSSLGFEAPFSVLKVGVDNSSSAAVKPAGIKIDGGKGSGYFLGTLKVDAGSGVAASGAVDFLQASIWSNEEIAAGSEGSCCVICAQNPSRSFSSLKVSIFY